MSQVFVKSRDSGVTYSGVSYINGNLLSQSSVKNPPTAAVCPSDSGHYLNINHA